MILLIQAVTIISICVMVVSFLTVIRRKNTSPIIKNMSILLISHDLENITHWTHKITVMYSGQFVEAGTTEQIFKNPLHPYTKALVDSSPSANIELPAKSRLMALPGTIPILQHLPIGCRLGPRCPRAQQACVQAPTITSFHDHKVSCHYPLIPTKAKRKAIKEVC